jgi:hypothetical protein
LWTSKVNEGLEKLSRNERNAMEAKRNEIKEHMTLLSAMCLDDIRSNVERMKIETLVTI